MPRTPIPSGRKFLLLLALAVAVIGGTWWWQRPPPEPVYNGQLLSEWVTTLDFNPSMEQVFSYPRTIRAFGPEAVPWLIYTVEHGRNRSEIRGPLPLEPAPDWLRRLFSERWGGTRGAAQRNKRTLALAAFALSHLGPEAAAATPALGKSMEGADYFAAQHCALALHAIGPASWPAVRTALEKGSRQTRTVLLETIARRIGTDAKPASEEEVMRVIEVLTKACRDSQINDVAATSLGACRWTRPNCTAFDAAIPVLIDLLSDSELDTRKAAASALIQFGDKAAAAVPRLIELLDETDHLGRSTAALALGYVDATGKRSEAVLRVMLYDRDSQCRNVAAIALRRMGLAPFEQGR